VQTLATHFPNTTAALRRLMETKATPMASRRGFRTGIEALDEMAPHGQFQGGAVHELLWRKSAGFPLSFALLLARAAQENGGAIAWNDPDRELYLPAVAAAGIDLRRLVLLRCSGRSEQMWALAECLRCPGLSAMVASVDKLSAIEARRLQLAAERGGGVGVLMRRYESRNIATYAAASRWLIEPAPGSPQVQRWNVELLHGHGRRSSFNPGRTSQVLLLEVDRETRAVRASGQLADRSAAPNFAQGERALPARATG